MEKICDHCDHIFERESFFEILNLKTFYLFSEIGGHGGHSGHRILYYFLYIFKIVKERI